jgi:AcrR family transcriptional regulator
MSARRALRPAARRRPGRPPGPSQAPQLRARLIDEASRLYAAGGASGLSFATVAARAGLTKPTVFHYFPNKAALLRAVFDALGERLQGAAENWFDAPPASYAARLDQLIAALVDFYGRDPLNARILCHGLLEVERSAPSSGTATRSSTTSFRRFIQFIADGAAAGEFHPDRPIGDHHGHRRLSCCSSSCLPDRGRQFRSGIFGATHRGGPRRRDGGVHPSRRRAPEGPARPRWRCPLRKPSHGDAE